MNNQTQIALEILSGYYGEPKWLTDPKEAQDSEKILETWDSELAPYSVQQVKEACAWLTRRRRVMTFPTISVLTTELIGKEPQQKREETKQEKAIRIYDYLLKNDQERRVSKEDWAKIAQKIVYDEYGISVDGYVPELA